MSSPQNKLVEIFEHYLKWVEYIDKFELELKSFESFVSDLQEKVQIFFKESVDSEIPIYPNNSKYNNANFIKFLSASTEFNKNITAY